MKEFGIKVSLPDGTEYCVGPYGRCPFMVGSNYCILLGITVPSKSEDPIKPPECPAYEA